MSDPQDEIVSLLGKPNRDEPSGRSQEVQILELDEPFAPEGASVQPPKKFQDILRRIKRRDISLSNPPEPIYALNGSIWATPGNFSTLSALSKAGKSAVTGGITASPLCGDGDTLGFSSSNPEGKALIIMDTEQSDYHFDKKMISSMSRKGYGPAHKNRTPDWMATYSLAGEVVSLDVLEAIMWHENARCGGVHSVILDGVADFAKNVNDPEEAGIIAARLMKLAKEYNTHILAVIHVNPSGADSGKTRGHLGSQLERKAETNLTIKITPTSRVIYARNARDCDISEDKGTKFAWSDEHGTFMTQEGTAGQGMGVADILEALLAGAVPRKDLKSSFEKIHGVTGQTINRHISAALVDKLLAEAGPRNGLILSITEAGREKLKRMGRLDNPPVDCSKPKTQPADEEIPDAG